MQYYGLLYSVLTCRSQCPYQFSYRQRAATFAQSFKQWFTKTGAALPFGRSLTYRFAQSSFFAVGAFADIEYEGFTKNEGKYLLLQNMRYWFRQPIFTQEGFLSIGYAYPNLNMAEGYNAPGSPYWAFKNFCVLAIPADAEFWTLEEQVPHRCAIRIVGCFWCITKKAQNCKLSLRGNIPTNILTAMPNTKSLSIRQRLGLAYRKQPFY